MFSPMQQENQTITESKQIHQPEVSVIDEKNKEQTNDAKEITCPNCGTKLQKGSKFCSECGTKIENAEYICKNCGSKMSADGKFCSNCGTRREN